MSKDRTFEGKDLAEALTQASEKLRIPEPDLDYEIIEQGRRGLFGLGAKSVQIRVMPPIDQETKAVGHGQLAGLPPARPRRGKPRAEVGADPTVESGDAEERRPRRRRRRRRSGRGRVGASEGGENRAAQRGEDGDNRDQGRRQSREPAVEKEPAPPAPDEAVAEVQATVEKMVGMLGLELTVKAQGMPGGTEIELEGADQDLLSDEEAEAVGAWQFLLNRMSRRTFPEAGRIQVYCNGHRQTRDEDLLALARETGEQVLQEGRAIRLRPMNSYERRLVHLTVRKMRGVDSRSEGDGAMKRVRVFKRRRRRRRSPRRPAAE